MNDTLFLIKIYCYSSLRVISQATAVSSLLLGMKVLLE